MTGSTGGGGFGGEERGKVWTQHSYYYCHQSLSRGQITPVLRRSINVWGQIVKSSWDSGDRRQIAEDLDLTSHVILRPPDILGGGIIEFSVLHLVIVQHSDIGVLQSQEYWDIWKVAP